MKDIKKILNNLLYILKVIFKYDKYAIIVILLEAMLKAISPFILIIFPRLIIDEITEAKRVDIAIIYVAIMGALYLLFHILSSVLGWYRTLKGMKLYDYFCKLIAQKSMITDFHNLEDSEKLNEFKKAKNAIWYGTIGITSSIVNMCSNILQLAGLAYLITTLNPLIIAVIIVVLAINSFVNAKVKKINYQCQSERAETDRKGDYLLNIMFDFKYAKDIRLYEINKMISEKYNKNVKSKLKYCSKINKYNLLERIVVLTTGAIQDAGLYIFFAYKFIKNAITIGAFTMYIGAVAQFSKALNNIILNLIDLRQNSMYVSDFISYLEMKDCMRLNSTQIKIKSLSSAKNIIEFKNVWFRYPNQHQYTIQNLNIKIEPNEKLSVVGENGAGKSTFVKLLMRLYDPTVGVILLNGTDIRKIDYDEYMKLFSPVFQDFKLFSYTIKENIAFENAYNVDENLIYKALEKAGISEKIKCLKCDLDTYMFKEFNEEGIELSGGEQQKIALARSFFKNSPIVVLDEPTAALDPLAEYNIYKRFNDLVNDKIAVYISHRMSSSRFCDKVALFEKGQIIEYGTHDELMNKNGKYAEMFNIQALYYFDA